MIITLAFAFKVLTEIHILMAFLLNRLMNSIHFKIDPFTVTLFKSLRDLVFAIYSISSIYKTWSHDRIISSTR